MSIVIVLQCDACLTKQTLCNHYSPLTTNKGGVTIEDAISLGWKVNDDEVFCPDCAADDEPEPEN